MKKLAAAVAAAVLAHSAPASADEPPPCPPEYEACLTKDDYDKVVKAVEELDRIKKSEAKLEFKEPVVIVRDWKDRVYVNGGAANPVKARVTLGDTIDREMSVTLPTRVTFRPEPPEPQFEFRARVRANVGILIPEIVRSVRDEEFEDFWSFGVDLDFVKLDVFNINAHLGSAGVGGGVGVDITKNFGASVNVLCTWVEWGPTASTGVYFSFN